MIAIGIDPGTRHVGYGIVAMTDKGLEYRDSGTISSSSGDLAERLVGIHRGLQVVMREWQPEVAVVETAFFGKNVQTAIKIGEGQGVALLSAAEAEVKVIGYEPTLVKKSVCGNGRASKEQVARRSPCCYGWIHHRRVTTSPTPWLWRYATSTARGSACRKVNRTSPAVLEALGGKAPKRRGGRRRR